MSFPAFGMRAALEAAYGEALKAVDPEKLVAAALRPGHGGAGERLREANRLHLLAVGKAAAPMARAAEKQLGARLVHSLAVVPQGYGLELSRTRVLEASHPVPDASSLVAASAARELTAGVPSGDRLLVLLSGGASSLLALPAPGLGLQDLAHTTSLLLAAGTPIESLNAVRKHLSELAGGRLALCCTAGGVEVLLISDVPGDAVDVIGSGPFAADASSYADALDCVRERGLLAQLSPAVRDDLLEGAAGRRPETPAPGDPRLQGVCHTLLASNATAREAACAALRERGWRCFEFPEPFRGEASRVGASLASLARATRSGLGQCFVAGGESRVQVRGSGRGGRSQELALAAAQGLQGLDECAILAAGTDGRDGPTDAAGAYADGGTLTRGKALGLDAARALEENDSHGFFSREGGVFRTGPT
ncbi:MAG: DUF4147 domain-containing protein, partial [Myxococcota bacterium]